MNRNATPALLALAALMIIPAAAAAGTWEADTAHTRIGFSVRHMMISNVSGEFGSYKVVAQGDPKDPSKVQLDVVIQAASIDTKNSKRDDHLRGPDFFDAAKYPTLRFKSKKVVAAGKGQLKVIGALTIRNVTKEVTLEVSKVTAPIKDPWGAVRLGVQAAGKINRKEFGLTWNKALEAGGVVVGNEVTIVIEAELIEKK